jgi:hypothetical protein
VPRRLPRRRRRRRRRPRQDPRPLHRPVETDAKAVHAAALAHDACATGAPEDWEIPAELADRISSVTRKRTPGAPNGAPAATRANPLIARPAGRWTLDPRRP